MDRVDARTLCRIEYVFNVQVGILCRGRADGVSLVSFEDMQGGAVYLGINRDRGDSQFTASTNHAYGNLAAIGY